MENIDLKQKLPGRLDEFRMLHRQTLEQGDRFWAGQAKYLKWQKEFVSVVQEDFSRGEVSWFGEGRLNAAENALHRIIEKGMGQKTALKFYPGPGEAPRTYSFHQLNEEVLKLAAALHQGGLKQGDCIALNLPNGPEFIICALAAAYLGVTYLPIGGHLPAALVADDVRESRAKLLVIAAHGAGEEHAQTVHSLLAPLDIITVGGKIKELPTLPEYTALAESGRVEPAYPRADHPLFAIYENRLAGQPVGAVFATGGFLVQARTSFDLVFNRALDRDEPEIIVNTLDPSKSACQAYGLWGPLTNGIGIAITGGDEGIDTIETLLEGEGNPAMICRPGLISDLRHQLGQNRLDTGNRFSVIACCGGALSPRLADFAAGVLVRGPEHLVNMWVQNKSGTSLIHTYPSPELNRPGSLGFGALGVEPLIINDFGQVCKTNVSGNLVFSKSWPAMGRPTRGAEAHFKKTYFSRFGGLFETYDGLRCDQDGFHWFMGRLDDVIKVRGQNLGTSQIESVIVSHPSIDEAVIVSTQGDSAEKLTAFVVTRGEMGDEVLFIEELKAYIAEQIGRFALPEKIVITGELPRTATGKLVRRLLKRIVAGDAGDNEDTGHLANAESVKALIKKYKE
ncbi:MAG: AMP-binding protein [Desulfobacter sp.]|nr:MAG: AMP-binding protein [Desulfobacter sp.]